MKKGMIWLLCSCLLFTPYSKKQVMVFADQEVTSNPNLDVHAPSAILIEATTGRVLYEKNSDEKLYPASMTKMMGMYLILDAIAQNKLKWEDEVTASEYACSMGGTQIYLEPGEKMTVEDMFKSVAINSANDAITALGEHLAGTNKGFVDLMNKTAKKFAMNNTNFKNPTGFDDLEHVTTARDMSLIAKELVKFDELLFRFTCLKEAYVREGTSDPFWLVNTNRMLGNYNGMDGLKTGFTSMAGYNLTATAKRNGIRVISVVMHEETIQKRSQDTTTLLNYGFANLKVLTIFATNTVIYKHKFQNTLEKEVELKNDKEVYVIVSKETKIDDLYADIEMVKTSAPLKAGEVVAILRIHEKNGTIHRFEIKIDRDIAKSTFWDYLLANLSRLFA